ncbi:MAG: hypothetical protein KGY65_08615 [Candidatus Thermoplasmatota archaeon]|nr:hypothetical protein [Candidatus Thermoplasmatota archaeon]
MDADGWHMMDWDHHMVDWWGFPFLGYWFIGIVIGVGLLLVFIILRSEKMQDEEIMSDADKTLDERYAKGEMSRDEYIQAKEDLKKFRQK